MKAQYTNYHMLSAVHEINLNDKNTNGEESWVPSEPRRVSHYVLTDYALKPLY